MLFFTSEAWENGALTCLIFFLIISHNGRCIYGTQVSFQNMYTNNTKMSLLIGKTWKHHTLFV